MAKAWEQEIDGGKSVIFDCPGCGFLHVVHVSQGNVPRPVWTWNGSVDAPTFSPSIAVSWRAPDGGRMCHSFVREGKIEFLSDCTHSLAGQTVELPEVDE
jgi:hypothetical protein